jgi:transposase
VLLESPEEAGYDAQAWTPQFVQHWLKTQFDVEYTLRYIRRLMYATGLSWRTARPEHYDVDPDEVAEFQETFKKSTRAD